MNKKTSIEVELKQKKSKLNAYEYDLDELKEHIELVSFNLSKVYRQAKDRSRKGSKKAKHGTKFKSQTSFNESFYEEEL